MAPAPIRLMIVDDHEILREGLANLLSSLPEIAVIGQAADGAAAVEKACHLKPDIILMDITMPVMNGIEATRSIRQSLPACSIIALSMHEKRDMAEAMTGAGACAYVSKDAPWEELRFVIKDVFKKAQGQRAPAK